MPGTALTESVPTAVAKNASSFQGSRYPEKPNPSDSANRTKPVIQVSSRGGGYRHPAVGLPMGQPAGQRPRRWAGDHSAVQVEAAVVAGAPHHRVTRHVLDRAPLVGAARLHGAKPLLRILEEQDARGPLPEDERVLLLQAAQFLPRQPQGARAFLRSQRLQVAQHGIDDAGEETEEAGPEQEIEEAPPPALFGHAYLLRLRTYTIRASTCSGSSLSL